MVGSENGEIYYFKRTANNTTYLAIGFPVNINHSQVMFKTSSGFEGCAIRRYCLASELPLRRVRIQWRLLRPSLVKEVL